MAAGSNVLTGSPSDDPRWKNARTRSGMSSERSRKGGRRIGTTLRRKNKSSRNVPCWMAKCRSLFVAATILHVGLDRGAAANRRIFALLQHAQKAGLGLHRHVADFIEKQGSAFRLFKAADGAGGGAGEGALLVAEQLAFDEIARNGGHVDGDERAALALAVVVQRFGDEFLAGAGFPEIITVRSVCISRARMRKMSCIAGERPTIGMTSTGPPPAPRAAAWVRPARGRRSPPVRAGRRASADIRRRRARRL